MSWAIDLLFPLIFGAITRVAPCPCAAPRRALLHQREIGRTHVHFVHLVPFLYPFYERGGLFPVLWKSRVGMQRVPILFRFFLAGMSHEVDECVGPSRIIVGHP